MGGGQTYAYHITKYLNKLANKHRNFEIYLSVSKNAELYKDFKKFNLKSFNIKTYDSKIQAIISFLNILSIKKKFINFLRLNKIDVVYSPMFHLWNFLISKYFFYESH